MSGPRYKITIIGPHMWAVIDTEGDGGMVDGPFWSYEKAREALQEWNQS